GLARLCRVVIWDRRGHGESGDLSGQGTREQDSDDLAGLIEVLGIGPAHVVGNSFGGSIALGLAARRPDLFRSISVHEPPVFEVLRGAEASAAGSVVERIGRVNERLATGDMTGGAALFVDTVVGQAGSWESFSADAQAMMVRHAPTFLDENRDPGVFALDLEQLARFEQPALLSFGDASPGYFARTVERVAAALPNARVHVFAGAGHVPHRTHPGEFVEVLSAFLQSQTESITQ
ncbi:MAG: alpha/beta hydrolase, partial [Chloroflexota bacterium]|nr:alpha/beta hydrolase [Chloroflexota bacterium]